jgi:hypothetical protein
MAQLRLLTTRSLHDVVVVKPTSARELIVIPTYLYPGSSPRLQVALRDPRHRLEGPVIPLEQRFVAEGRYILSHGPKATSLVTQWSRATALHLRPRAHGKANSPNDARIVPGDHNNDRHNCKPLRRPNSIAAAIRTAVAMPASTGVTCGFIASVSEGATGARGR